MAARLLFCKANQGLTSRLVHVEFHFRYRAEQDELPTRPWKQKVSFGKTHFLL